MYQYFKSNKRKDEGDCVVRAFMVVTGWDWYKTFDYLCAVGKKNMSMPNSKTTIEKAALELGFKKGTVKVEKGQSRPTVKQIASHFSDCSVLVQIAHHLVGCEEGNYYDTWDSGSRSVYTYYYKSLQ